LNTKNATGAKAASTDDIKDGTSSRRLDVSSLSSNIVSYFANIGANVANNLRGSSNVVDQKIN
jgi:hypothetical protein